MEDKKTTVNSGIGFPELLTVVFIVLKLLGIINWSWWLVLAPLWISLVIVLVMLMIFVIIKRKEYEKL